MAEFKLPNGITIGDKLYNMVNLEEMTGRQQNLLIVPKPITAVDHIEPVLKDLITDIRNSHSESITEHLTISEAILHHLPIQDIQFLLIKLRMITFDPEYYIDMQCTHCNHKNKAKLDLSSLELKLGEAKLEPDQHILPKKKLPFSYRPMTLADLKRSTTLKEDKNIAGNMITEVTAMLLGSIGDKTKITSKDLLDLSAKDLSYIQQNTPTYSHLDDLIEHTCTNCGEDFSAELPTLVADFLLPSRT